jgi:hypothetical protein
MRGPGAKAPNTLVRALNPKDRSKGGRKKQKAGKVSVERSERLLLGDFFGILHCVQDDGRNLQR